MHAVMRSASLTLALAAWALSAVAESAPPSPRTAPAFGERIDVRAVDVEAAVTDRAGQRVMGLSAADFRLLVDGREVPIDSFSAVVDGRPIGGSATGAGPILGRNFLVFVDDRFSIAVQRDQVLSRLAAALPRLGPDDHMAVVAFDGERLSTLAGWTGDRTALAAALGRAKTLPAEGNRIVATRCSLSEDYRLLEEYDPILAAKAAFGSGSRLTLESPEPRNIQETRALVYGMPRVLAATDAALRTLLPPPGRRVLLLLSGGWPFSGYPALFWPLTATANRLGYTFYPVDVPGLDTETLAADAGSEGPGVPPGFITSAWERDSQYSLELLARATGGKAILNSARLTAFERATDDTRSYYRLGFSPTWRADDRRHAIRVEVRRPGLQVRARTSYTDLSTAAEGALEEQRRQIAGEPESGAPGPAAAAVPLSPTER